METAFYDAFRSLMVAHAIQAEAWRSWRNAALAVATFPTLFAGGCYVEGWMVLGKATTIDLVEHGWCCTAEPRILDPTLVLREPTPPQAVQHYAGLEIAADQLRERTHGQILPLVCHTEFGPDGMGHPGYQQAFAQARQHAHTLARQRHLPPEALRLFGRDPQRRGVTLVLGQDPRDPDAQ